MVGIQRHYSWSFPSPKYERTDSALGNFQHIHFLAESGRREIHGCPRWATNRAPHFYDYMTQSLDAVVLKGDSNARLSWSSDRRMLDMAEVRWHEAIS